MQVLDRNGEDREGTVPSVSPASPAPFMSLDATEPDVIDTELEIRASHITAAAVAAAAVTAAVATMAPMPEAAPPVRTIRTEPAADTFAAPQTMPQPSPVGDQVAVADKTISLRGTMGSVLTLAVAALAWWGGNQLPLPSHGLKPALQNVSLPSLRKPGSVPPLAAPVAAVSVQDAPTADKPAPLDAIALLQQESEIRMQQLAERRAASQARRQREDAAAAAREQRRRDAEAQLADARARAERAPATVAAPVIVAVPEVPPLAEAVRQCSALSVFARESCLWKLCSGKWGKDGCPSYQNSNEGA